MQLAAIVTDDPSRQKTAESAFAAHLTDPQLGRATEPGICHGLAGLYQTSYRVAQQRPTPPDAYTTKINQLATALRAVITLDDPAQADLFDTAGPAAHAINWLTAFREAGDQLGEAAAHGRLGRGLRAILTHVVIFHWNRIGLSANSQAVLARAPLAFPAGRQAKT